MNEMDSLLARADKYLQSARLLLDAGDYQFIENVRQYLTGNEFV